MLILKSYCLVIFTSVIDKELIYFIILKTSNLIMQRKYLLHSKMSKFVYVNERLRSPAYVVFGSLTSISTVFELCGIILTGRLSDNMLNPAVLEEAELIVTVFPEGL